MSDIILTTQNARYSHTAFGLRYLRANLGTLRDRSNILEYDLRCTPEDMTKEILATRPRIISISVYIWNARLAAELIKQLKAECPAICVIIGGPEVTYDAEGSELHQIADYVICGEGEEALPLLCKQVLNGHPPAEKIIRAAPVRLEHITLPYGEYSDEDVARRLIYVETTRGCPFECEYCISSLEGKVRRLPLRSCLREFRLLLERGVRQFKFVDRTFNVDEQRCIDVMSFFLEQEQTDYRLHFEMMPDRFSPKLRQAITRFPEGALHFEIGIQTYNEDVARLIKRKTHYALIDDNLRFLREQTAADIHADLIAGLPGEPLESLAVGFDRLVHLRPHALQFGILKKLHGAPIARHDNEWQMVYSPEPPYEVISTKLINEDDMTRLKRFARYWDLLYNRGNFERTVGRIWEDNESPFAAFMAWSEWLFETDGRTYAIPLDQLAERLFEYLTTVLEQHPQQVASLIWQDYHKDGARRYPPKQLRPHLSTS